jgi:hypothetical protein
MRLLIVLIFLPQSSQSFFDIACTYKRKERKALRTLRKTLASFAVKKHNTSKLETLNQ